jgi:predicted  nucleic acid-binding Zn-ribbon protein
MHERERLNDHQKFKELAALAQGGALTSSERMELKSHLELCSACRAISSEYSVLSTQGMAFLAADCGYVPEAEVWNDRAVRNELFSRIRESESSAGVSTNVPTNILSEAAPPRSVPAWLAWNARARWAAVAAAVCLLIGVATGAYQLGDRKQARRERTVAVAPTSPASTPLSSTSLQELTSEKKAAEDMLVVQTAQISRLQKQISGDQRDLAGLRASLHRAEDLTSTLSGSNSKVDAQLRQVSEERDKLAAQVRDAEKAYQLLQAEFTNLRAEHDRALLHTASLESKIEGLSSDARDQNRRLKDDEQYLASDRDIRELMGARKLYIADVFDVDSGSRTRKPFGRVFYTQNKSLIFYAFDLDHEPGVKNASTFQVWGQKDGELNAKSHPMNLGILYMDSESNRRWVLRWDDPKQLAEIDAVFVTVEPQGGSQKPTGKPFLYALLRKEANHP